MTEAVSILPTNSTPWEIAVDLTSAERHPWPVDVIRDVWDPWKCPEHLLPYLAASLSVDIWDPAWPVARRRYACDQAIRMHRLKGTLEGIRLHIAMAGFELIHAIVPPETPFYGYTDTDEERQAFLDQFPQLRVYSFRSRGTARGGRGFFLRRQAFLNHQHFVVSDAPARIGRNAYLWDKGPSPYATGDETALRYAIFETVSASGTASVSERLAIPGRAGRRKLIMGRTLSRRFISTSISSGRTVTVQQQVSVTTSATVRQIRAVSPSLEPVRLVADKVTEHGTAPRRKLFMGRNARRFLTRSTAHLRVYDRYYLHDRQRSVRRRRGRMFLGHFRFGIPAYTAELLVKVRHRKRRPVMFYSRGFIGQCLQRHDGTAMDRLFRAVRASKAYRDKLLIDTRTTRYRDWSDGIPLDGSTTFGRRTVSVLK